MVIKIVVKENFIKNSFSVITCLKILTYNGIKDLLEDFSTYNQIKIQMKKFIVSNVIIHLNVKNLCQIIYANIINIEKEKTNTKVLGQFHCSNIKNYTLL